MNVLRRNKAGERLGPLQSSPGAIIPEKGGWPGLFWRAWIPHPSDCEGWEVVSRRGGQRLRNNFGTTWSVGDGTTKNQIAGFCYDAAGNLLRQGGLRR
jgi:hypothetical protein